MPKKYRAIMMDPPWPENGGGKCKRGADRHYETIKTKEAVRDVILGSEKFTPHDNSHLFLWVTNNYLPWALWLMPELGFKYKTNFPWVKTGRLGIGQYARGCHELLLFGVRGKGYDACQKNEDGGLVTVRSDFLVGIPRPVDLYGKMIHSAKPSKAYELVETRSIGPYLDMFARHAHSDAWDTCGNQEPGSK